MEASYNDTLRQAQFEFTKDIGLLIAFIYESGFTASGGEWWRSLETQKLHFDAGRSKTMKSNHLNRLALDLNFFLNGKSLLLGKTGEMLIKDINLLKPIGAYWMSLNPNNKWGADWNKNYDVLDESFLDPYHFQRDL